MAQDDEAFRRGFLYELAAHGLTPERFGQLILEKAASVGGAASGITNLMTGIGIGGPVIAGTLAGYGAYNLTKPDYNVSIQSLKNRELVDQLKLSTRKINQQLPPQPEASNAPPVST